ncbi:MAG: DUF819 family protein [Verrucomicrobiae bacterium]|nr:DUF819 family protein [Verrucomicrobiae bacterium]
MNPLIPATDTASLWALIAAGTATAIWLEQTYRWAARLSAPVLALLIAMLLANLRIVPTEAPAYEFVGDWLVPLAIPLLLFRANVREILRTSGQMFLTFHIASVGTLLGTGLAVWLLRDRIGSPDTAHAAGVMAASYTGGGVNFMAVKSSYGVSAEVTNPLIVADNFVMAGAFVALLGIAASPWFRARYPHPHSVDADAAAAGQLAAQHWQRKGISLLDIAKSFAFAFLVMGLASALGRVMKSIVGDTSGASAAAQMLGTLCTNRFVLLTLVSLVLATVFARPLSRINGPEEFGTYLLSLFLFTLGLPADLMSVLIQAPLFFVFCGIIAVVNLGFTLAAGRLLRLNLEELLLAVNATLGGAPSAAAMAVGTGWPRLVLPGILVGIWGYVVGTPIGIVVVEFFLKR